MLSKQVYYQILIFRAVASFWDDGYNNVQGGFLDDSVGSNRREVTKDVSADGSRNQIPGVCEEQAIISPVQSFNLAKRGATITRIRNFACIAIDVTDEGHGIVIKIRDDKTSITRQPR